MAKIKFYLDGRNRKEASPAALKIRISHRDTTSYFNLNIPLLPGQWNEKTSKVVNHDDRVFLNTIIKSKWSIIENVILKLVASGEIDNCTANDIRDRAIAIDNPFPVVKEKKEPKIDQKRLFAHKLLSFAETRRAEGTRSSYRQTYIRLKEFDPEIDIRTFEDINKDYMLRLDNFLAKTNGINARNVYYRNIRAVFNDAIDDELTTNYPFRKFKIKNEPTKKRSLTVEQLRILRDFPCEEYQIKYRDIFMLMVYLLGVNAVDLFNAPKESITNGRFEYRRAKTGKFYSIKVEPEAYEIIERYKGTKYLLDVLDDGKSYKDYLHRMGEALKEIGPMKRVGRGGKKIRKPLFPDISQYWCRHTWATLCADIDIPKETIAAGLGHDMGNSTTAIYINYNIRKVDEANRKLIDYISGKEDV